MIWKKSDELLFFFLNRIQINSRMFLFSKMLTKNVDSIDATNDDQEVSSGGRE